MSVINKRTTNNVTLSHGKKTTTDLKPKPRTSIVNDQPRRQVQSKRASVINTTRRSLKSDGYCPKLKLTNCLVPGNVEDSLSDDEANGEESVGSG